MSAPLDRRAVLGTVAAVLAAPAVASTIQGPTADERLITAEQFAALEFSPWIHVEGEWRPPDNETWTRSSKAWLPCIRIAWFIMHKTKEELEIIARDMGGDSFEELLVCIGDTHDFFNEIVAMLSAAETRLMCGAVSDLKKYDPEGFVKA